MKKSGHCFRMESTRAVYCKCLVCNTDILDDEQSTSSDKARIHGTCRSKTDACISCESSVGFVSNDKSCVVCGVRFETRELETCMICETRSFVVQLRQCFTCHSKLIHKCCICMRHFAIGMVVDNDLICTACYK